ncbi:hypothetical protein DMENIID0001_038380 [Sergentomyia squamirostris]
MLSKSGLFVACLVTLAVQQIVSSPVVRVKRNDDLNDHLDPINQVEDSGQGLEREKRKLPDAVFGTKNALLGLVFSKIDSLIDSKTRFIDALDQTNVAKNKQYGIESPPEINSFQSLISAIIQPKIQAITSKLGGLSGSFLGGAGGGFLSSGGTASTDASGGSSGGAGVGSLLSSLLRFSGPLLSSSTGGGQTNSDDLGEDTDDDDGSSAPKKIGKGIGDGDVAQLDRNKVALDIPSELFANSFNTVTNLSKIAGNFIMPLFSNRIAASMKMSTASMFIAQQVARDFEVESIGCMRPQYPICCGQIAVKLAPHGGGERSHSEL